MPHFQSQTMEQILYIAAAVVLLVLGYQIGRWIGALAASKKIAEKENDLFTAQKGFKQLYETELTAVKQHNAVLVDENKTLALKVDDYRKKAAGFGGLFNSGGKKADAMYALLLENEALEEALQSQNEKLKQGHTDSMKEQLRAAGYRRVLMSQLMNDERIKGYIQEIMADEKNLPAVNQNSNGPALPG